MRYVIFFPFALVALVICTACSGQSGLISPFEEAPNSATLEESGQIDLLETTQEEEEQAELDPKIPEINSAANEVDSATKLNLTGPVQGSGTKAQANPAQGSGTRTQANAAQGSGTNTPNPTAPRDLAVISELMLEQMTQMNQGLAGLRTEMNEKISNVDTKLSTQIENQRKQLSAQIETRDAVVEAARQAKEHHDALVKYFDKKGIRFKVNGEEMDNNNLKDSFLEAAQAIAAERGLENIQPEYLCNPKDMSFGYWRNQKGEIINLTEDELRRMPAPGQYIPGTIVDLTTPACQPVYQSQPAPTYQQQQVVPAYGVPSYPNEIQFQQQSAPPAYQNNGCPCLLYTSPSPRD